MREMIANWHCGVIFVLSSLPQECIHSILTFGWPCWEEPCFAHTWSRMTWLGRDWKYAGTSPADQHSAHQPRLLIYSRECASSQTTGTFTVTCAFPHTRCNMGTVSSFLKGDADRLQAYNLTLCYSGRRTNLFTHFVLDDIPHVSL